MGKTLFDGSTAIAQAQNHLVALVLCFALEGNNGRDIRRHYGWEGYRTRAV